MRLFITCFFLTLSAFAANWSDLEAGKTYTLTQPFQLKQLERSRSLLDFSTGDELVLKEIAPLTIPGAVMNLYIFDVPNCPGEDLETDMEIIPVKGTTPLVEVGAYVVECELNIYLELKDYYFKSIFE